jgi:alkylation response protein AidB-like acyl-CoA dehydrogenase
VAQQGVQLHGAIAMTDDYVAGRYFKRLTVLESMFGDAEHFRLIVAEA